MKLKTAIKNHKFPIRLIGKSRFTIMSFFVLKVTHSSKLRVHLFDVNLFKVVNVLAGAGRAFSAATLLLCGIIASISQQSVQC